MIVEVLCRDCGQARRWHDGCDEHGQPWGWIPVKGKASGANICPDCNRKRAASLIIKERPDDTRLHDAVADGLLAFWATVLEHYPELADEADAFEDDGLAGAALEAVPRWLERAKPGCQCGAQAAGCGSHSRWCPVAS